MVLPVVDQVFGVLVFLSACVCMELRHCKNDVFSKNTKVFSWPSECPCRLGCWTVIGGMVGMQCACCVLPIFNCFAVMVDAPSCPPMFLTPFVGDFTTLLVFCHRIGVCLSDIACSV